MTYKYVFIVLVYRNTSDLIEFFGSQKLPNSQTIVVNSYYDENTEYAFRYIANQNAADFISVPNKGYGAGNNAGVKFALDKYDFEYLIISNADITIKLFDESILSKNTECIIAPEIIAANGKKQNPSEPFKPSQLLHWLINRTYCGNHRKLIWVFFAWLRIKRIIFIFLFGKKNTCFIYSAHGSFVIFPKNLLLQLVPLYNEKMFLMNEEGHLAKKALEKGIRTLYVKQIVVNHKEDGSISIEYKDEFNLLKQSFSEFYKYWYN